MAHFDLLYLETIRGKEELTKVPADCAQARWENISFTANWQRHYNLWIPKINVDQIEGLKGADHLKLHFHPSATHHFFIF